MTTDTALLSKTEVSIKIPNMYNVIFYNDEVTPFELVISALTSIFYKTHEQAVAITNSVHMNGKGIAGTYTKEVAEEKVYETIDFARSYGYPLVVTAEAL
jgi:ATP-dependent Clp protease adaptor protein ClpS